MTDKDALALFEAWYEQEVELLYRFVWVRVRDTPTAEELTASICERALSIMERYDPARGTMRAWMYGIARNEIRSYLRQQGRRPDHVSLDALHLHAERSRPVEQRTQRRELMAMVVEHLSDLPAIDQEIVALRYGSGLANPEIAKITGLTTNNVAVRLHRAIKKLRRSLTQEGIPVE